MPKVTGRFSPSAAIGRTRDSTKSNREASLAASREPARRSRKGARKTGRSRTRQALKAVTPDQLEPLLPANGGLTTTALSEQANTKRDQVLPAGRPIRSHRPRPRRAPADLAMHNAWRGRQRRVLAHRRLAPAGRGVALGRQCTREACAGRRTNAIVDGSAADAAGGRSDTHARPFNVRSDEATLVVAASVADRGSGCPPICHGTRFSPIAGLA